MNDQSTPGSEPSVAGREPKVIKRYTNRKLYDTVESRYVTLDEIAQMIKAGAEVQIIDNRTKEDLTSVTLAQIIFEVFFSSSKMICASVTDVRSSFVRLSMIFTSAPALIIWPISSSVTYRDSTVS